jgi:hypothetical protein
MIEDEGGSVVVCDKVYKAIELGWKVAGRCRRECKSIREGNHAYSAWVSSLRLLLLLSRHVCPRPWPTACTAKRPNPLFCGSPSPRPSRVLRHGPLGLTFRSHVRNCVLWLNNHCSIRIAETLWRTESVSERQIVTAYSSFADLE